MELLVALFFLGLIVGGQLNRGIYRLAWFPRWIGPWSAAHEDAPQRRWFDYVPVVGWLGLRREAAIHGPGFWIRPLLIELGTGFVFAWLYWWEHDGGLISIPAFASAGAHLHTYISHITLFSLMVVATFIDFDEMTIPDTITVPGTLIGLTFAATMPDALLPIVHTFPPPMQLETLLLTQPGPWIDWLSEPRGLACGLGCYVGWCMAVTPKLCTLRRGWIKGVQYMIASTLRHRTRVPRTQVAVPSWMLYFGMAIAGSAWIAAGWHTGGATWRALLTSLVGMAFSGGIIWAVRLVGTGALKREAMGFGDVTLMAMIGTYIGWQPCLVIFFVAPFVALLIAVAQWVLTTDKEIPYGPYLCIATVLLVVNWADWWIFRMQAAFQLGMFIPAMVGTCLILMFGMLSLYRIVGEWISGKE